MKKHLTGSILVLSAAALLLASCGDSSSSPTAPSPNADVVIRIVGMNGAMSFSPASATARVGQTVAWQNADSITHDVVQDGGGFNAGTISAGATSAPITVTAAGTLPYHCAIHPTMVGTLTVTQ
jgi:plastocyanin